MEARLLVLAAVVAGAVVVEDVLVPVTTGVLVVEALAGVVVCFLPVLIMLEISIVISLPKWVGGNFWRTFSVFKRNYLNL